MNIPTKPEGFVKASLKKLGWVAFGILVPDCLLGIAACELIAAVFLLRNAYTYLPDLPAPPNGLLYRHILLRGLDPSYKVSRSHTFIHI